MAQSTGPLPGELSTGAAIMGGREGAARGMKRCGFWVLNPVFIVFGFSLSPEITVLNQRPTDHGRLFFLHSKQKKAQSPGLSKKQFPAVL